jgi:hypothetical protein
LFDLLRKNDEDLFPIVEFKDFDPNHLPIFSSVILKGLPEGFSEKDFLSQMTQVFPVPQERHWKAKWQSDGSLKISLSNKPSNNLFIDD